MFAGDLSARLNVRSPSVRLSLHPRAEEDPKPGDLGKVEEAKVVMPEIDLSKVVKLSTAGNGRTPSEK